MTKQFLFAAGLLLTLTAACDKLNSDKTPLADEVAQDDRGAKAVIKNVLLNTDIGIALTDTNRFGQKKMSRIVSAQTDSLYPPDTWHCWASHAFGTDTITAGYWVRYAPNFNGYLNPLLTDTAYISHVTVSDSIDKNNTRIYFTVNNTSFTVTGLRNWINPASSGALIFNGMLNLNIYYAVGKLTLTTSDDLNFYNNYQLTLVNLQVPEGSTTPNGGSVNFTMNQTLVPEKPNLNGTILGNFTITGSLTFSGTTITLVMGTHSYSVTINPDRTITINPL